MKGKRKCISKKIYTVEQANCYLHLCDLCLPFNSVRVACFVGETEKNYTLYFTLLLREETEETPKTN